MIPVQRGIRRAASGLLAAALAVAGGVGPLHGQTEPADTVPVLTEGPLGFEEVLASIESRYPPYLIALIERDLAEGRLGQVRGAFDLELSGKVKDVPNGYYEYSTVEAGLEQFLGLWGSTIFGGYRLTEGEELPDYYPERTQEDGEFALEFRLPILKGGAIDAPRAAIDQAFIDARAVDPFLARLRLDFLRAAGLAWAKWVAAGLELAIAQASLDLAVERTAALEEQVDAGSQPEILLVDNEGLVVARQIDVFDATQKLQSAAISLSLFYRNEIGDPIIPGPERLPELLPIVEPPVELTENPNLILRALDQRPELVRLGFDVDRARVDVRLARNQLLPTLDLAAGVSQNVGDSLYFDRTRTELQFGLQFKFPLQNRAARGKLMQAEAKEAQAMTKLVFARDKVAAEVDKAIAMITAAERNAGLARRAVELARTLLEAENLRFQEGASDFLDLQIREQKAFDAQRKAVKADLDLLNSWVDLQIALGERPIIR